MSVPFECENIRAGLWAFDSLTVWRLLAEYAINLLFNFHRINTGMLVLLLLRYLG